MAGVDLEPLAPDGQTLAQWAAAGQQRIEGVVGGRETLFSHEPGLNVVDAGDLIQVVERLAGQHVHRALDGA